MSNVSLFDYIKFNLLQIKTPELMLKMQLKKLADKISQNKIKFINFKYSAISVDCANFIYEIYKIVSPWAVFFKEDFSVKNTDLIAGYIIESNFTKEQKEICASFTKEEILKAVKDTRNPSEAFTVVKENFKKFQKSVTTEQIAEMNSAFNALKNLSQIYTFDFYLFLKFFDPMMSEANLNAPHKFKQTTSLQAVDDLIKFDSAVFAIPVKQDFISYMNVYLEYHGIAPTSEKKIKAFLAKIKYLQTTEIISDVIKYMLRDFNYRTITNITNDNIYTNYLSDMTNSLKNNIENVISDIKSERIGRFKNKIFTGIEMVKLPNLNDDYNTNLEKFECKTFEYIEPLQYTETFIKEIYSQNVRNILNDLCVIAEFSDKTHQKQYLDAFYNVKSIHERIMELDENFSNIASDGKRLRSWIISKPRAQQNKALIETMINKTDSAAKAIIIDAFNSFLDISTIAKGILDDCRNATKKEIINGVKIVRDGSIDLRVIESAIPQIEGFLALLKNFIR